jgi:hypothetical protein
MMGKWLGGLIATILAGVAIYYLTTGLPDVHLPWKHYPAARMSSPEPATDRGHGDLRDVQVSGFDECLTACLAEARCQAVSFNTASNQCWMKDSVPTRSVRPGFTSSVKYTE